MQVGVPKEVKDHEYRVGLIPANVRELTQRGHTVWVEQDAGVVSGFSDEQYLLAGAKIASNADEVFKQADMIVKVKEPQKEECLRLRAGQLLFAFLHLAPDPEQTELLLASDCIAIAYETVTDDLGGLPLLTPMSEIAGRLSIQVGARCLEKVQGGRGILLGGVPGVPPAKVVVVGGGAAGMQALRAAVGLGADVTILDKSLKRLREIDTAFKSRVKTRYASTEALDEEITVADLVIGAVLVPGAAAPKILPRDVLRKMRAGSVVVDISIDQGGCFESSRPTTHSNPIYIEEGIVHYCVTNMPAGVPHTSSVALNNVTLPFVIALAEKGHQAACLENPHLLRGLNIHSGRVTHNAVASALNKPYVLPEAALGA
jgi:alanine dehydrogenase